MDGESTVSKIRKIDIFTYMIIVLSILAIFGIYSDVLSLSSTTSPQAVIQMLLLQLLVSVAVATVTDTLIKYAKTKQFKISKTGIITGLFVGSILTEGTSLQIVALAAFLAEALKHLIRYQGRNIFNPTLLSLFLMALILKTSTSWWTAVSPSLFGFSIPIVVILGLFISYKFKRFSLTIPTLAVYFVISLIFAGASSLSLQNILQFLQVNTVYFFVFFMVVEPKSSPVYRNSRIVYGITAAILLNVMPFVVTYLAKFSFTTDAFLLTILISNAIGRLYESIIK